MEISQRLISFGSTYFKSIRKPSTQWTTSDKLRVVSLFSIIVPLLVGCVTLLGYAAKAITGRVRKDLSPHVQATSNKVDRTVQASANPNRTQAGLDALELPNSVEQRALEPKAEIAQVVSASSSPANLLLAPVLAPEASSLEPKEKKPQEDNASPISIDPKPADRTCTIRIATSLYSASLKEEAVKTLLNQIENAINASSSSLIKYKITHVSHKDDKDLHLLLFNSLGIRVQWSNCNEFVEKATGGKPNSSSDILLLLQIFGEEQTPRIIEDAENAFPLKDRISIARMDINFGMQSSCQFEFDSKNTLNNQAIAQIIGIIRDKCLK